jgi:DnaK suppressor protein
MSTLIRASDLKRPQTLRALLARRRDEIYMRIRELRRDQEHEAQPSPADTMEAARATADIETHASLIGRGEEELRLIDEALDRVEHGTYGVCADCGGEIPLARLNSVPFAPYCVECEGKRDPARRRWSEGGTIAPYDHQWAPPEEMRTPREYRVSTNTARPTPSHEEAHPAASAPAAKHEPSQGKPSRRRAK